MRAVAFLSAIVALSVYKGKSFYVPFSIVSSTGFTFYLLFSVLRNKLRVRSSATYVTTTPEDVYTKPGSKRTRKNVCVIGAGPSGIATAKELLDEGHNVTCFEKYHDIGGVFLYSEKKGGAYDSTLLTIGNYLMAYSDFPPLNNEKYKFWHHTEYLDYLRKYIDHNMLYERANFQFDTEVVRVERAGAGWTVTTKNCKTQKTTENTYDAVAICSGTHQVPNIPKFKGQETSPIVIRHSETYKNAATDKDIKDKRVVSIGIGETGADISAEIAQHAESAWLAIRRTPHVVARNHWNLNHPADVFSTRAMFYSNINYIEFLHHQDQGLKAATAGPIGKAIFKGNLGLGDDVTAKIAELGKRSGGGVSSQFLTKNDKFIPYLLNGKLVEKPSIDRLEGRTVHFTDGSFAENVDTIMLCTGFVDNFPFLPKDLQIKNVRGLYKHAFNPEADTSIAYIGFSRPSTGGVPACSEAVARYWSLILSNQRKLPNDWKERTVIEGQAEKNFFHLSSRINTLVFWGQYIESLACHIDCQPKLLSYFITRPWFWISLFYGPLIPAQFRLRGPHATPAAAEKVIANAPVITPTPFLVAQSATSILSFIGGSLFGFRAPMW